MANRQPTVTRALVDDSPAVRLAIGSGRGSNLAIITDDAIALGPSTVTYATGLIIDETMAKPTYIQLGAGEELWGICDTGADANVQVLQTEANK